jgi:hypothetical protein
MIRVLFLTALSLAITDPAQTRFDRDTKDLARELAKVKLKPLSTDDYDARRSAIREQASEPNDFSFVLEKLEESRIKEYPSTWSRTHKRAIYTLEVRLLEQARDIRARAESKSASEKGVDQTKARQKE